MIKHNTYFNGTVQSLGFSAGATKMTVGVMEPGTHDFGKATAPEEITVVAGAIEAKGKKYGPGQKFSFQVGDAIVFVVPEISAYLCTY